MDDKLEETPPTVIDCARLLSKHREPAPYDSARKLPLGGGALLGTSQCDDWPLVLKAAWNGQKSAVSSSPPTAGDPAKYWKRAGSALSCVPRLHRPSEW